MGAFKSKLLCQPTKTKMKKKRKTEEGGGNVYGLCLVWGSERKKVKTQINTTCIKSKTYERSTQTKHKTRKSDQHKYSYTDRK